MKPRTVFAFLMSGALTCGACSPVTESREYADGMACIVGGETPQTCYAMCSATYASRVGSYVRACAAGVRDAQ